MQGLPAASVDLIYLDPPFKSDRNYNLLYRNLTGRPVPEQVEAFCDTWELDAEKEHIARTMPVLMREAGIPNEYVQFWRMWMDALRNTQPKLMAYLVYMVQRLLHMRPLLRPTGSIYLHCDPEASHYIKVMMDAIFGHENFRNEIIWRRTGAHSRAKRWGPIHDVLLFYTKSDNYVWNRALQPQSGEYVKKYYRDQDIHGKYQLVSLDGPGDRTGNSGMPWRGVDPTERGRHWEVPPDRALPSWVKKPPDYAGLTVQERLDVLDEQGLVHWPEKGAVPRYKRYLSITPGKPVQDIISDIRPVGKAKERLGYPTQKPLALLERIIRASSNPGDVVFDPFCGCGTTVYAAHETGRGWIGCDIAMLAVNLIQRTLRHRYRLSGETYTVSGIPVSVEQAQLLQKRDPHNFQTWVIEKIGGFPTKKKGADRGIDGRIYFETAGDLVSMVLSVKGGMIRPTDIRDLRGVLEREDDAIMAGFLSLRPPTPAMQREAAAAGLFELAGVGYPRIQILTVTDILEEKRGFKTPTKITEKHVTGQLPLAVDLAKVIP